MSIAEIERFVADLKSNEALRAEAGKAQAETSQATPMDRVIAFAASKGYAFTADEVKEHAKAKQLTDAELAGVVGGSQFIRSIGDALRSSVESKQAEILSELLDGVR
jgi:predicted ribosomally synthesized peptide with nif11-like leader